MGILKCKGFVDSSGQLNVNVHSPLQPGDVDVDVVLIVQPDNTNDSRSYDFSDLIGKLSWSGDALSAQKQLRHEWT
ncbi:MAG: hypothetical protein P9L94_07210 [Candidatus Hinthialibacter antarcticus]|nr:hypothetical protein [Candidatus Hinthialibacter antarcticus]